MKLLNFSTGQIRTIEINGAAVQTAHVKRPVAEPWLIDENGAVGDRRAVHPDKLYAYARTGYDYWSERLGVGPGSWPDGFFGENLTLDTLDEQDVRVGDVLAIGDQVRLVVAGARTPCAKLAWRLGQPRAFQRAFALSRHTGVYLGVLETGAVRPGDVLRRVQHDPAMPSIADLCDYVASHDPPPLEPLQRLLAFDHLSPTIRLLLGAKLDAAERAAAAVEGRWRGWRPFVIDAIREEARDIRSVQLRPADGQPLCRPRPGQFVTARIDNEDGSQILRSWSVSSFAHAMDRYRLTVRRQSGAGSNWLHRAQPGTTLMLRAPAGHFVLDEGFRPVVMVAAGIGITPLLAMLQAHLLRPTGAAAYLFYGARSPADLAFRGELDALAEQHPHFHASYRYSRRADDAKRAGRITPDTVVEGLADLHVMLEGRRIGLPWFEADIYICGPGAFCTEMREGFIARGANPDHLFIEQFTAVVPDDSDIETAQVRFARSDLTVDWHVGDDLTLLDLAERAGLTVAHDCRSGACLTCKTRVVAGSVTAVAPDGEALLCIGRPATPDLVLDL